jgi:hypothetical protein
MNELTQLRVKDNITDKIYRLIGFSVGGDDRAGFPVSQIVLYNDADRIRINVINPLDMKRLQLIKE